MTTGESTFKFKCANKRDCIDVSFGDCNIRFKKLEFFFESDDKRQQTKRIYNFDPANPMAGKSTDLVQYVDVKAPETSQRCELQTRKESVMTMRQIEVTLNSEDRKQRGVKELYTVTIAYEDPEKIEDANVTFFY